MEGQQEETMSSVASEDTASWLKEEDMTSSANLTSLSSSLSLDVWAKILEFLPAHDLLLHVGQTSQSFASIVRDDCFWKSYVETIVVKNDRNWNHYKSQDLDHQGLSLRQLAAFGTAPSEQHHRKYRCLAPQSLLPTPTQARAMRNNNNNHVDMDDDDINNTRHSWSCLASTTHHSPREGIECTLAPAVRSWSNRPLMPGWWSSMPSPSGSSSETQEKLLYKTKHHATNLQRLAINPLVDAFRGMVLVYGWHYMKVTAYYLPRSHMEQHNHNNNQQLTSDAARIEAFLQNQTPVYESPLLASKPLPRPVRLSSNAWEVHEFPLGIVANVICLTLHGKKSREMMGYYACVEQVRVEGIPLFQDTWDLNSNLRTLRGIRSRLRVWDKGAARDPEGRVYHYSSGSDDDEDDDDDDISDAEGAFSSDDDDDSSSDDDDGSNYEEELGEEEADDDGGAAVHVDVDSGDENSHQGDDEVMVEEEEEQEEDQGPHHHDQWWERHPPARLQDDTTQNNNGADGGDGDSTSHTNQDEARGGNTHMDDAGVDI